MALRGLIIMTLEIIYELKRDKKSEPERGYTYYHTKTTDFKKAVTEANKHFVKFRKESGWSRSAKLKSITLITSQ